jgi:hypothetical protein
MQEVREESREAVGGEVAVPDHVRKIAEEAARLVREGKSVEEAILATQHLIPNSRVIGNRVEYIKNLNSIAEVDRANHTAHGKLSKARKAGNQEAIARYLEEIRVSNERKNFLEAQISKSDNPFQAAVSLGASESGLVQMLIAQEEAKARETLEQAKKALQWTNKMLKTTRNNQDTATPQWFLDKLAEVHPNCPKLYQDRLAGGDKRVETLNRSFNLIASLTQKAAQMEPQTEEAPSGNPEVAAEIKKTQDEIKAKAEAARAKFNKKG